MIRLRILEILEEQGHTKYWLYKRMDMMSYRNFKNIIENETSAIRFETLEKLTRILQVPVGELFKETEEERSQRLVLIQKKTGLFLCLYKPCMTAVILTKNKSLAALFKQTASDLFLTQLLFIHFNSPKSLACLQYAALLSHLLSKYKFSTTFSRFLILHIF